MIQTVIFDLSEVLIAGLIGVEKPLSARLQLPEDAVRPAFRGDLLYDLFCGKLTEDAYIDHIIQKEQWHIAPEELKLIIRRNFHHRVSNMDEILAQLSADYELILLSDHAVEWVDYIKSIHPFLSIFKAQYFSFEIKTTKREPSTFQTVLERVGQKPARCLFIDDNPENVMTATSLGISGIQFTTARELSQKLVELGMYSLPAARQL